MKISSIEKFQNEVLIRYDKDRVCATCCLFPNRNKERYQKLLEFYYTGKRKFISNASLHYLYFGRFFDKLSRDEMNQITYYRLFMLEIFKDVVRNEKI